MDPEERPAHADDARTGRGNQRPERHVEYTNREPAPKETLQAATQRCIPIPLLQMPPKCHPCMYTNVQVWTKPAGDRDIAMCREA
jgi:hypothetical protein